MNVFMQVTIMFYEHAIDDVTRVFGASEQVNLETVFFKTGLTGSTGLIGGVLSFNPVIEQWVAQWT
jgi:hypothetical protein